MGGMKASLTFISTRGHISDEIIQKYIEEQKGRDVASLPIPFVP